jgi:hypothetical protein
MATIRTVTVKTAGGDYASLVAAEAGEQGDLVALDRQLDIECYDKVETLNITIDGSTTDATRFIKVVGATTARHNGIYGSVGYRLETNSTAINIQDNWTEIDGIQIKSTRAVAGSVFGISISLTSNTTIKVSNCIIQCNPSGGATITAINLNQATTTLKAFNNIIFGTNISGSIGITSQFSTNVYSYNNTLVGLGIGLNRTSGNHIAKNNLCGGCTAAASGTFADGTDYNVTDGAAIGYTVTGGGNTHDRLSQTFSFVDAVNKDWHLTGSDAGARGYGVDLSADANLSFTTDIDGQTRSGAWDIGADQYVAGGGVTSVYSDLALLWDIFTAVSSDLSVKWDILNSVSSDLSLRFGILNQVFSDLGVLWDVRTEVNGDLTILFDTRSLVASDLSLIWDAAGTVFSDLTIKWDMGDVTGRIKIIGSGFRRLIG